ncbi:hypothetical protein ILUMI_16925 [Ignelater luminosus]|uniref:PiggyBac transposable element-derived protein domain-containing protein n=1 Tax=Ignelater luminosus TaxID=2038154 RepID=A0A8K0CRD9_IGNLU|nr:hypothetical protein ILUMI_16925 [Ignelater luminosus]
MVKFKGRSSIKQYTPNKPIQRGYKVWIRADSVTAYVHQFQIYTRKAENIMERKLGERVVVDLTRELVGKSQSLPGSRSILFISSFHDPYIIQKINCKHKEDDGISIKEIPCPKLVKDYNQYMGDVEKQEVVATHILQGGQMKLKDFRIAIAAGFIGAAFEQKRGRPSATKAENKYKRRILHEKRYSEAAHLPEFGTKRRCNFC